MQLPSSGRVHRCENWQIHIISKTSLLGWWAVWILNALKITSEIPQISDFRNTFYFVCGPFQNRGVACASYVLRVRFAATERSAKTPQTLKWPETGCNIRRNWPKSRRWNASSVLSPASPDVASLTTVNSVTTIIRIILIFASIATDLQLLKLFKITSCLCLLFSRFIDIAESCLLAAISLRSQLPRMSTVVMVSLCFTIFVASKYSKFNSNVFYNEGKTTETRTSIC